MCYVYTNLNSSPMRLAWEQRQINSTYLYHSPKIHANAKSDFYKELRSHANLYYNIFPGTLLGINIITSSNYTASSEISKRRCSVVAVQHVLDTTLTPQIALPGGRSLVSSGEAIEIMIAERP